MSALRDAIVKHLQAASGVTALVGARIYPGLPPKKDTTYPFITVEAYQPPAANRSFQEISHETAVYLCKAIDRSTSPKLSGQINAAIRAALDGAAVTITGYTTLSVTFLGSVEYDEQADGITYQHEGSLIEVWANAT